MAEAFLVRKRREKEAVETRRGSPMGTGEEWQKQSLGRGRSWESARGCSAGSQREGERKGAQGDVAPVQTRLLSVTSHGHAGPRGGSPCQTQPGQARSSEKAYPVSC